MPLFVLPLVISSPLTSCTAPLSSLGHRMNIHWTYSSPVFLKMVDHKIHAADYDQYFQINEIKLNRKVKEVPSTCIRVRICLWTYFRWVWCVGVWTCVMCVSTMQNAFPNVGLSLKIFKPLFPHFPLLFLYCAFLWLYVRFPFLKCLLVSHVLGQMPTFL